MSTPPVTPESQNSTPVLKPSPLLVIGTLLLLSLNTAGAYAMAMRRTSNMAYSTGAATANILMPVLVALLFSISPRFRNTRSRTKVMFWTSLVIFISTAARLGRQ